MGQHFPNLIFEVLRQTVRPPVVRRAVTAAGMSCRVGDGRSTLAMRSLGVLLHAAGRTGVVAKVKEVGAVLFVVMTGLRTATMSSSSMSSAE